MAPESLRYTATHEWCVVRNGIVIIGVTEHVPSVLAQITCVDLPEGGADVLHEVPFGELEGTADRKDLMSPFDGVIAGVNERTVYNPDLITDDPYGKGWLIRLKPLKPASLENLLSANEYEQMVKRRR